MLSRVAIALTRLCLLGLGKAFSDAVAMKTASGDEGDSGKKMQHKGGPPLVESGTLFTRLHVNESEKAGSRAPPRNKMALYEQFTVPSHRFVPSPCESAAAHPYPEQYEPKEYQSSHSSPCTPSVPPFIKAHNYMCPSFGTSDGTSICGNQSQEAPWQQLAAGGALLDNVAAARTSSNFKCMSEKKAKEFSAPVLSSDTFHDKTACSMLAHEQGLCGSVADNVAKLVKRAQILTIGDGLQEAAGASKAKWEESAPQTQGCSTAGGESAEVNRKVVFHVTDEGHKMASKQDEDTSSYKPNKETSKSLPGDSGCQQSGFIDLRKWPQSKGSDHEGKRVHGPSTADVEIQSQCGITGECTDMGEKELNCPKESLCNASHPHKSLAEYSFISKKESEVLLSNRDTVSFTKAISEKIVGANTGEILGQMPHHSAGNKCGRFGETETPSNCSGEAAELSQHDIGTRRSSHDLELLSAPHLSPKAVIKAVGQLRFWKARLALLRQQQIFSDQVFELHKLIEVQRLLAETPNILIDDIYFGTGDMMQECDADAHNSPGGHVVKEYNNMEEV